MRCVARNKEPPRVAAELNLVNSTAMCQTSATMPDSSAYAAAIGQEHRRRFGQFFTDPRVARFMLQWVLGSKVRWLYDPAFGLGAFRPADNRIRFAASEIDGRVIDYYRTHINPDAGFIRHEDYLKTWGQKHANIICNPPYMRFQKFIHRAEVFRQFQSQLGVRLSGYTNTASAFLLKSLSELDGLGRLAYIMPPEFLNAGYGLLVKESLIRGGHLFAVLNLACEKDVFPDATTSVCIILYDAANVYDAVRFYTIERIEQLQGFASLLPATSIPTAELQPAAKWSPYFSKSTVSFDTSRMVPLDFYGRFSRGIATGANEFFVLSQSEAESLKLSPDDYRPCITRSVQIKSSRFGEPDLQKLIDADAPVFLFSANGSASSSAKKYIAAGETQGYHQRFLTRHRTPWYKTEARTPSPILLGVFSRGGYKVVLNESAAINLTCYHGFQPNPLGRRYVKHLFLYLQSQSGREVVSLSLRKYGDALDKFEPNDLNTAYVPTPEQFDRLDAKTIAGALKYIRRGEAMPAAVEKFFELMLLSGGRKSPECGVDSLHPTIRGLTPPARKSGRGKS